MFSRRVAWRRVRAGWATGEDAGEAGSDVFGGDIDLEFARHTAGVQQKAAVQLAMPFPEPLAQEVDRYARSDLPGNLTWHIDQFSFLADDPILQRRVGEEFFTTRYLYKLLEGVHLDDQWAVSAQARLQVLQYASIYEACLHHVLFELSRHDPRVQQLGKYTSLKQYDVPPNKFTSFEHDGRQIVSAY
jgi:hypothetical protein